MEFRKEDKKYTDSIEELTLIFTNIYDKLLPMLSKNEESLMDFIARASLPKKQRLIKRLQSKILYSPSEIVEIRNCVIEVLSILITDERTFKKFVDIIILFGKLWKEGKINLYDLIYNSNEYINSKDPVIAEKIKTYILIESEFIDRVLDLKIKLPARSVIISEFFYQTVLYFNELNNELMLESSKQKSNIDFNYNLTLNDKDSDILKWNLMDNKAKHYMQYLSLNLNSPLDKTLKEIIVYISRDSQYSPLLLTKPYSKFLIEYMSESKAYVPFELLSLITSNLINKNVQVDYEICEMLLNKLISKETKEAEEQANVILQNKTSTILMKSLANLFIGDEESTQKMINSTNILKIVSEVLNNGARDNKTTKWIDENFINLIINTLRVVAGLKIHEAFSSFMDSNDFVNILNSFKECPNKYIQQYTSYILGDLKQTPKENLKINIEKLSFKPTEIEAIQVTEQVQLRTDLINNSNNCLDVPQIKEGYYNMTPCDGNGVVIISGCEEESTTFNFIGMIVNIFTKEINDSTLYSCQSLEDINVYFFNHYCNLRKHWSQVPKDKVMKLVNSIYTSSSIIPGKDSQKIESLLHLTKTETPLEEVYKDIIENLNDSLDKKYLKSFYWWREFLGSEFNNNIQFKYSDLIYNEGFVRPKYYQLKTNATTNDVPPNPDSYINYWLDVIENTSNANFELYYSRISIYLLHTLIYFKNIFSEMSDVNNDDIINTLKNSYIELATNYKNGNVIVGNVIFRAMIERTIYIEQEEELILPAELYMIFSSSRNNLILPIQGIIRKSSKLLPVENRIKNAQVKKFEEMLLEIVKQMYNDDIIDIQSIYHNKEITSWVDSLIKDKTIAKQFLLNTLLLLNSFIGNVKHLILSTSFEPVEDTELIQFGFQSSATSAF